MRTIDVHEEDAAIAAPASAVAVAAATAIAIDVGIGGIHSSHRDNIRAKEFQFCMSKSFFAYWLSPRRYSHIKFLEV